MFGVFTAFVAFLRRSGWSFIYLLYFSCGMVCSVYGALGWDPCGIHSVCSTYDAFGLVHFHGAFRVSGALGQGPLWHSQPLYCLGSVGVGRFVAFTAFEAFGVFLFCGV